MNIDKCSAVTEMGDRLATVDMGQKLGLCTFWEGELGPHLTMWPGPSLSIVCLCVRPDGR